MASKSAIPVLPNPAKGVDYGTLQLHAQDSWHAPAYVMGDRPGLMRLRDALDAVLSSGPVSEDEWGRGKIQFETFAGDDEGYTTHVAFLEEGAINSLQAPYTDMEIHSPVGMRPCDVFYRQSSDVETGAAIQAFKDSLRSVAGDAAMGIDKAVQLHVDSDGYPPFEVLQRITTWPLDEGYAALFEKLASLFQVHGSSWVENDGTIVLVTGGWSGNEDLIAAMQRNGLMWGMCWQESRRGGRFTFSIPKATEAGK